MLEAVQIEWWDRPKTCRTEIALWNHLTVCEFYYEFHDLLPIDVIESYYVQRSNLSAQEFQA